MITKRFIAGAVCPRCGEMDRLVSYEQDGKTVRECVACDFSETLVAQVEKSEMKTRVNHIPEEDVEEQVTAVKILDPGKLH
jgi:uncharacterized metal-binding protein (TIGR02443 family)